MTTAINARDAQHFVKLDALCGADERRRSDELRALAADMRVAPSGEHVYVRAGEYEIRFTVDGGEGDE